MHFFHIALSISHLDATKVATAKFVKGFYLYFVPFSFDVFNFKVFLEINYHCLGWKL